MSRNKEDRPNGAAAEGGRPIGGAAEGGVSVFFVSAHLFSYIMNIYGYSLYIPYILNRDESFLSSPQKPFAPNLLS